mgnify:CR=1 FL=1
MKPDFLVIGAPKAATTALCYHLARHPEICFSRPKETFFFSDDTKYQQGWPWYESLFNGWEQSTAVGEGTTHYAATGTFPNMLPRIVEHVPDAKIIYIVREPLRRMQSMWMEHRSQGIEPHPFNHAVLDNPIYLDTSMYWRQLSAYREHYDDDRILLLFYDDYAADANAVLARCFRFLGVDPEVVFDDANIPRYTSDTKREDFAVTNCLRRSVPGFLALRDRSPTFLRRAAKRLFKRPMQSAPEWDPKVKGDIVQRLRPDKHAFLAYCDYPNDFWEAPAE